MTGKIRWRTASIQTTWSWRSSSWRNRMTTMNVTV
jgi:hypothetical protein